MPVEMDVQRDREGSEFDRKTVTLSEALQEINEQIIASVVTKSLNPVYQALRSWTGMKNMTAC